MAILGLDISTSCTGYCLLDDNGSMRCLGYIPLGKHKTHFDKANRVLSDLREIKKTQDITIIAIEENLQSFRSGFSSAQTLSSLAKFNGVVAYLCEDVFGMQPQFFNVNSSRKSVGLKIISKRKGGADTKEQVLTWAKSELGPSYTWPTKILQSGPRKNQVVLEPGCYDMADAYVIARAAHLEHFT